MRFWISLFILFSTQVVFSQSNEKPPCIDLRTGNFYVLKGSDTCFVRRTETRQFEQCQGNDVEYELIVVWLKDNKYILRDIHYNPTNAQKVMRKDVVMTILEVKDNYHIVNVRQQGQKSYQMTVYCHY